MATIRDLAVMKAAASRRGIEHDLWNPYELSRRGAQLGNGSATMHAVSALTIRIRITRYG